MFRKLKKMISSKMSGIDVPKIIKSRPLQIKATDKICILAPHPDDEMIGCGGFLIKYASQCEVILLTDGSLGGPRSTKDDEENNAIVRSKEFCEVMTTLGVKEFSEMKAKDGYLLDSFSRLKQYDFSKYDYIFLPHKHDSHKDHVLVRPMMEKICSANKNIKAALVSYEVWNPMMSPSHYLDISDVAEQKKEIINMYISQVTSIDYASRILGLNHYRGVHHQIDYAEAYNIEK